MRLTRSLAVFLVLSSAIAVLRAEAPATKAKVSVLIVGGGTSHDFNRWWKEEDAKTLSAANGPMAFDPSYTDKPADAATLMANADVLMLPVNQLGFSILPVRQAMKARAEAGKGIVILHAGAWYMYRDWPEYNSLYVGGGAHGHDKLGPFEVTVTAPDHPLMKGVPAKFTITDELYHMEPDAKGTPIEVLATATSPITGKTFPSVWIVKHPKTRIVVITLGHDGRAHDLPAYQTMLLNAAAWAAGKD